VRAGAANISSTFDGDGASTPLALLSREEADALLEEEDEVEEPELELPELTEMALGLVVTAAFTAGVRVCCSTGCAFGLLSAGAGGCTFADWVAGVNNFAALGTGGENKFAHSGSLSELLLLPVLLLLLLEELLSLSLLSESSTL
jgi:hypothetical protein